MASVVYVQVQRQSSQAPVIPGQSSSSRAHLRQPQQQLSASWSGMSSSESQWPFRGGAFHLDSRSALAKSMERAVKQQELSDGYRALFGELPVCTYQPVA